MGKKTVVCLGYVVGAAMLVAIGSAAVPPAAKAQALTDGEYRVIIDDKFGMSPCPSNLEMEAIAAKGKIEGSNDQGSTLAGTVAASGVSGHFTVPEGLLSFTAKKAGDRFEGQWSDSYGECSGVITLIPK